MSHAPQRWIGIVLRIVRADYPDARLVVWGAHVEHGEESDRSSRLEIAFLDPPDPPPEVVTRMRGELEASEIPVPVDLRVLSDLTIVEQEEVLQRGEQFGG